MFKQTILAVICLMSVSDGFALLPPLYHTAAEIKGMLSSPQLGETLDDGEAIESIVASNDGFIITTTRHKVDVKVAPQQQQNPGPAQFRYVFGQVKNK